MAPTTNRVDVKAFIRESRAKKKLLEKENVANNVENENNDSDIVMFETTSSTSSYNTRPKAVSIPLEPYFTLICRDGEVFSLPLSIAKELGCVRTMLATESFKETEKNELHLQELDGDMVEKILQFCFEDSIFNPVSSAEREKKNNAKGRNSAFVPEATSQKDSRVVFLFSLSPDVVMDIMMAAHFLQVPRLVDIACKMLADNFLQLTSIEGIPDDIVLNILRYLSPECLVVAESMDIIKDLPINLQQLWKAHFEKKKWLLEVSQCLGSAENATVEEELAALGFSLESVIPSPESKIEDIKEYNEVQRRHVTDTTTAQLDWRQLFLETDLDHKIRMYQLSIHDDKVFLFADDNEEENEEDQAQVDPTSRKKTRFFEYVSNCSKAIRKIKVPDSVDEIFVKTAKSGSFKPIPDIEFTVDILSRLTQLRQLDMSGHKNLATDPEKAQALFDCIVNNIQGLRSFKYSKVAMSNAVCKVLAQTLLTPKNSNFKLRSLDLSDSKLSSQDLLPISEALSENTTLWALYLSDNRLTDHSQEKGLASLFSVLGTNKNISLRLLDLGNHPIQLEEMNKHNPDCLTLFSQNRSITHLFIAGALKQARTYWCRHLPLHLPVSVQFLDLSFSRFSTHDLPHLFEGLLERASANPEFRLVALDLSDSVIQDEAFHKLAEWIMTNPWLSCLGIRGSFLSDTEGELLASAIRQRTFESVEHLPLSVLCLDINNLGKSAFHIAQAFVNQLPNATDNVPSYGLTRPERNVLSITRNPLFTHYVPAPAPLDGVPIAQIMAPAANATEAATEGEQLSEDEKIARDVKLRSGVRMEALFRTSAVKQKNVHLIV
eukprot:TRINITY_DN654_c0_g1_i1.p1 TRINITY_DN654_c0_g1~~TRINITY_DN654_c0_g1_i1.p1  ORF type:complete len:833 (+),score=153.34 TRINITY_DN654_c0_g1_i1:233-2731(+)